MIEFLSMLAIWCGSPNYLTTHQDVFKCRERIFNCVMEMKPLILSHPTNAKLISECAENFMRKNSGK